MHWQAACRKPAPTAHMDSNVTPLAGYEFCMQHHDGAPRMPLTEWRRHLRSLIPPDAEDDIVVVRASLIEWLVEDLDRAASTLDAYEELEDVLRRTLAEWSGSVEALRAITRALERIEREREGTSD